MLKNITEKVLKKANKDLLTLLLKIVNSERGGNRNKVLKNNTGKLRKTLKTVLEIRNDSFVLNMTVVNYFKYLDKGSSNISKPWFLTEDFSESKEFKDIIQTCYVDALSQTIKKTIK